MKKRWFHRRLPWTKAKERRLFKPRLPYRDRFFTEQLIEEYCERDEIICHPGVLELLSTNLIERTYARRQEHDGDKWVTWPIVPLSSYCYSATAVDVDAGVKLKLCEVEGRGEVLYFGLVSAFLTFSIELQYDARVEYGLSVGELYQLLRTEPGHRLGQVTLWDAGTPEYAFMADPREFFTRRAALYVTNTDVVQRQIDRVIFFANLHEVRAIEEAKTAAGRADID